MSRITSPIKSLFLFKSATMEQLCTFLEQFCTTNEFELYLNSYRFFVIH